MYTDVAAQDDLSQGDIIANVLFGYVPISSPSLYDQNGDQVVDRNEPLSLEDGIDLMAPAQRSSVVVLSQDCDCLSKPYICVARIIPLLSFDKNYAAKVAGKRASLKSNTEYLHDLYQRPGAKPDAFYLQENGSIQLPKSVVSFLELHSIQTTEENIAYLKHHRLARLSKEAVLDLQFRLGFYFGRFATGDNYMLTREERNALQPSTVDNSQSEGLARPADT